MARDRREFGLTAADRAHELERKLGVRDVAAAQALLCEVVDPAENVLGAIVFLANRLDDLGSLVALANDDRPRLMNAATVKDERG